MAFEAWKKTDPFNNPNAPPGPMMMPEYHNAKSEESAKLGNEASEFFEQGTKARGTSDGYVRVTVLLATVLLLTAISQRFRTAVRADCPCCFGSAAGVHPIVAHHHAAAHLMLSPILQHDFVLADRG